MSIRYLKAENCFSCQNHLIFHLYIAFADYVITDSFHATAFSLNLNTTPICIYPDRFSGRIEDLLKLTNLERLHVINSEDWRVMGNDPINGKK